MKTILKPTKSSFPAEELPKTLPLLPLEDRVVFPNVVVPVAIPEGVFAQLLEENLSDRQLVVLGYPLEAREGEKREKRRFLPVGTLSRVLKMMRMKDSSIRLLVQGMERVEVRQVRFIGNLYICQPGQESMERKGPELEFEALKRTLLLLFHEMIDLNPNLSDDLRSASDSIGTAGELADFVVANVELPLKEKRQLLITSNPLERAQMVIDFLVRERNLIELGKQIQSKVKTQLDKEQREYYLREQLRVIRRELGEEDPHKTEIDEIARAMEKTDMPAEASEMANRELDRLRRMPTSASEYHVSRTYLDWLINLPWKKSSTDCLDIKEARRILDEDHYGLSEVKERIIQYLAVRQLKKDTKGPILCFIGPPGVGKTSLGKSIAHALNRKFCRIALGGIRDEAEIRGHRRTYIGSMPGRLIQLIRKVGVNNPVLMLDELDKLGSDMRSDPASALLEVLDPAQNSAFSDHYLEVNFNLSNIFFIATANLFHQIPHALRDRLETIEIAGYTPSEKIEIARSHLIPRQLEENGLSDGQLQLGDETTSGIINHYTRESGVRELEREIAKVARQTALHLLEGQSHPAVLPEDLGDYLGPSKYLPETAGKKPEIGVATALAWTAYGGDILFVEALLMNGQKNLELTGQLGDVMKESVMAAYSFLRANRCRFGIQEGKFSNSDIHLHVPSGATPKDGPSAGVAMVTALASLLSSRPVLHNVAMTGEITLRGKVLPVGGIKEKVLAAHRAGITRVILPRENAKDLLNLPEEVSRQMQFSFVATVDEVLETALAESGVSDGKVS